MSKWNFLGRLLFAVIILSALFPGLSCKSKAPQVQKKKGIEDRCVQERDSLIRELAKLRDADPSEEMKALMASIKSAMPGFNDDELKVEIRKGKIYVSMSDKLLFKSGSATVELKGKEALKSLAAIFSKHTDMEILVEGHTDNLPIKTSTYQDNWDLSTARATSIVRSLSKENKINPARLIAAGRGEYYPIADNKTSDGRSRNRRTEIVLAPNLDALYKILEN